MASVSAHDTPHDRGRPTSGHPSIRLHSEGLSLIGSARLQPQCRLQNLVANDGLCVGARLILPQEFAAGSCDGTGIASRERPNAQPAAGKLQRGGAARREVPGPTPLAAAHRTHENLLISYHHPDDHGSRGVFLGPDRDFPDIAQFSQRVSIELRHDLSPLCAVGRPATCDRAISLPPNRCLGRSKLVEFDPAQRCLCDREEFVELWRRRRRAAEHLVRLATMMDLVLEQMQQKAVRTLLLHACAAVYVNNPIGGGFVQRLAPLVQPAGGACSEPARDRRVGGARRRLQRHAGRSRRLCAGAMDR